MESDLNVLGLGTKFFYRSIWFFEFWKLFGREDEMEGLGKGDWKWMYWDWDKSVSYTHLTLPTIYSV